MRRLPADAPKFKPTDKIMRGPKDGSLGKTRPIRLTRALTERLAKHLGKDAYATHLSLSGGKVLETRSFRYWLE